MKKIICFIAIVMYLVTSSGCASYRTAGAMPSTNIVDYSSRQTKEGITVAVGFLDNGEISRVFQRNMRQVGIQPVFIIIQNKGGETLEFTREMIGWQTMFPNEAAKKCEFNVFMRVVWFSPLMISALFLPILIPVIMNGMGATKSNAEMLSDYSEKEIKFGRIKPGDNIQGFVYLDARINSRDLSVSLLKTDTDSRIQFSFIRIN